MISCHSICVMITLQATQRLINHRRSKVLNKGLVISGEGGRGLAEGQRWGQSFS